MDILQKFNKYYLWVFVLAAVLLFFQYGFVYMSHDDYGYTSLSYGYSLEGVEGHDYQFNDVIKYLQWHYNQWGGRILYFFFEIMVLRPGFFLYRWLQPIVAVMIMFFSFLLIRGYTKRENYLSLALIICSLYGLVSIEMLKETAYWATASFVYVWPMLFGLAGVYFYQQYCKKIETLQEQKKPILFLMLLCLCFFLAAFSQEQIGLGVTLFSILSLIIHRASIRGQKEGRKYIVVDSLVTVFSLLGYLLLMLAPGNMNRMLIDSKEFYQLSLAGKIAFQIPQIFKLHFNHHLMLFWIIFFGLLIFISYQLGKEKRGIKFFNWFGFGVFIFATIMGSIRLLNPDIKILYFNIKSTPIKFLLFLLVIISLTLAFYLLSVYLFSRNRTQLWLLSVCGILAQGILLFVPNNSFRLVLVFLYFWFLVIGVLLVDFLDQVTKKLLKAGILALVVVLSLGNFLQIFQGYQKNNNTQLKNQRILEKAAYAINNQQADIKMIKLAKLPNLKYTATMPYEPQYGYIHYWIKEYYNIPANIEIVWVDKEDSPGE